MDKEKKSYCVLIKTLDRRYSLTEKIYRIDFKICNGFRELREYILKCGFNTDEYVVYESTDIKIKKASGIAL